MHSHSRPSRTRGRRCGRGARAPGASRLLPVRGSHHRPDGRGGAGREGRMPRPLGRATAVPPRSGSRLRALSGSRRVVARPADPLSARVDEPADRGRPGLHVLPCAGGSRCADAAARVAAARSHDPAREARPAPLSVSCSGRPDRTRSVGHAARQCLPTRERRLMARRSCMFSIVALAVTPALLASCATISPKPGFDTVSELVSARSSGRTVVWNQGTADDQAAVQRVRELLAGELNLDSAIEIALLDNRALQAVYGQLGIAQADLVQAGLLQNPILSADVRFPTVQGAAIGAAAGLVQEFISMLQIPLKKRVAAAAFDEATLTASAAVIDLVVDVKRAFYRLQGAEQLLELRRSVADATALSADVARRQHDAGNVTDLDLANESALAEQARGWINPAASPSGTGPLSCSCARESSGRPSSSTTRCSPASSSFSSPSATRSTPERRTSRPCATTGSHAPSWRAPSAATWSTPVSNFITEDDTVWSRRDVLVSGATAVAGAAVLNRLEARAEEEAPPPGGGPEPGGSHLPVAVPNGVTLPWKLVDGVKVYHLVAERFSHQFAPGLDVECWGYNGRTPGPVIEAIEGDRVRIYVTNRLPEPTSIHWHGILLPNGMDGVSGLTQRPIPVGQTFLYEFTLRQSGSYMYHPHYDEMVQMGMGMMGMFVIHPNAPESPPIDRDFAIMLSEWAVKPGTRKPDPTVMTDFNVFTMNGKVYPATEPLVVRRGQRVRIRLGNLGATDHHPIHIHGHNFRVTGTDGGRIADAGRWPETTVLVSVGAVRDIEFVADAPGDWAFHCHMTHHVMNQMGHGLPNMLGVKPGELDRKVQRLLPESMTMGR